jgi:DNA anti-recombination protein RmuC
MSARIWSTTLAILLAFGAFGCESGGQKEKTKQQADDGEETGLVKTAEELEKSLDQFDARIEAMGERSEGFTMETLAKLEAKLEEFGERIDDLEEEAEDSTGEVKGELRNQIQDLRDVQGELMQTIQEKIEGMKE